MTHLRPPERVNSLGAAPGSQLTIIAIDDTEEVLSLTEDMLRAYGHKVFTAASGERGLEILRETTVDVVLCDLNMPGMSGWDVADALQAMFRKNGSRKPPFILVTGSAGQISEESIRYRPGVDGIVGKPVDIITLLAVIQQAVEKRSERS